MPLWQPFHKRVGGGIETVDNDRLPLAHCLSPEARRFQGLNTPRVRHEALLANPFGPAVQCEFPSLLVIVIDVADSASGHLDGLVQCVIEKILNRFGRMLKDLNKESEPLRVEVEFLLGSLLLRDVTEDSLNPCDFSRSVPIVVATRGHRKHRPILPHQSDLILLDRALLLQ